MVVAMSSALVLVLSNNLWSIVLASLATLYAITTEMYYHSVFKMGAVLVLVGLAAAADAENQDELLWLLVVAATFA